MNLELGIAPLVDSARSGWIVRHMGAEFHDGKQSYAKLMVMMILVMDGRAQ